MDMCHKPLYTHIDGNMFMYLACTLFWAILQRVVVRNYHYMLHNSLEERSARLQCGRSLKSCTTVFMVWLQARALV